MSEENLSGNLGVQIGTVSSFFRKPSVAAFLLENKNIEVGDVIYIKGHTTDFKMQIISMQIEGNDIKKAVIGQDLGMKVDEKCRVGDKIYFIK